MGQWLLVPPIAFIIVLLASFLLEYLFSRLSFRPKAHSDGEGKPYACGEENYDHMAQPDYSTFFPFAFFFTIAHVSTLIMTTVPVETIQTFVLAFMYLAGAVIGLYILLRS
ncbi:MAG: NADH-quinone oxidoreductase subunit A [Candidatus Omnitrophota bacterium]